MMKVAWFQRRRKREQIRTEEGDTSRLIALIHGVWDVERESE